MHPATGHSYAIALVTDTHLAPAATAFVSNWRLVRAWINARKPDLIVHLGDISANGESDASELAAVACEFSLLSAPIRFVPGNHDIGDEPNASQLRAYRNSYGSDYWSTSLGAWNLLALNAQLLGSGTAEEERQFDWLAEQVPRFLGPAILFLHKPIPAAGSIADPVRFVPSTAASRLMDILRGKDLRRVISGHTHQRWDSEGRDPTYSWIPSTSFCLPDAVQKREGQKMVGIGMLELTPVDSRLVISTPPGLVRHNALDFPDVYPQVSGMRERLGPEADLPVGVADR